MDISTDRAPRALSGISTATSILMTLVAYTGTSTATTRPMGTPPSLMALATDDHDTSIHTSP